MDRMGLKRSVCVSSFACPQALRSHCHHLRPKLGNSPLGNSAPIVVPAEICSAELPAEGPQRRWDCPGGPSGSPVETQLEQEKGARDGG